MSTTKFRRTYSIQFVKRKRSAVATVETKRKVEEALKSREN